MSNAIETIEGSFGFTATVSHDELGYMVNPYTEWDCATVLVADGLMQGDLFYTFDVSHIEKTLEMAMDIRSGRKVNPDDYGFDQYELNRNGCDLEDFLGLLYHAKDLSCKVLAYEQYNVTGEPFFIIATVESMDKMGCQHEDAEKVVSQDYTAYRQYLDGEVYLVEIFGPDGETHESCGCIHGFDCAVEEAEMMLAHCVSVESDAIDFERTMFAL